MINNLRWRRFSRTCRHRPHARISARCRRRRAAATFLDGARAVVGSAGSLGSGPWHNGPFQRSQGNSRPAGLARSGSPRWRNQYCRVQTARARPSPRRQSATSPHSDLALSRQPPGGAGSSEQVLLSLTGAARRCPLRGGSTPHPWRASPDYWTGRRTALHVDLGRVGSKRIQFGVEVLSRIDLGRYPLVVDREGASSGSISANMPPTPTPSSPGFAASTDRGNRASTPSRSPRPPEVGAEGRRRGERRSVRRHPAGLDVIGVAIAAEIVVGDHHLRSKFADDLHQVGGRHEQVGSPEVVVAVIGRSATIPESRNLPSPPRRR